MANLSVNLNKVALLRNQRSVGIPNFLNAARTAITSGADGITVHPRPDERHVRPADVLELAKLTTFELNIEGNPFEGHWLDLVRAARPTQATLVPDDPTQSTSDHGWDFPSDVRRLRPIVAELKSFGCRVSLFSDADADRVGHARDTGADRVELYTADFAVAFSSADSADQLRRFTTAARAAQERGLGVNAGHDLSLENIAVFLRHVPKVLEVSIGHALIADALEMGLSGAVRAYRSVCRAFD
jgi:pyridoxine 5-phosphate synthase